jgi:hypothetical protein
MSAQAGPQTTRTLASYDEEHGQGWVIFAVDILAMAWADRVRQANR